MAEDVRPDVRKKEPKAVPVVGRWVLYTVIVILAVGLPAMSLLSSMSRAQEKAKAAVCKNNLKNIGLALELYEMERKKKPEKLSDLYPSFIGDLTVFVCPAAGGEMKDRTEIDEKTSYVLVSPPAAGEGEDKIVAYCKGCCPGEKHNILLSDGRVVQMVKSKLERILAEAEE